MLTNLLLMVLLVVAIPAYIALNIVVVIMLGQRWKFMLDAVRRGRSR